MKKAIISLLLILNLSFLIACDPATTYITPEPHEVASIELINYVNNDAKEIFAQRNKVKPFDFSKMEIIAVLPIENLDEFCEEYSKIHFLMFWRHFDSPKGECIKINYVDGNFDVVCTDINFSCYYDELGNVSFFIGSGGGSKQRELIDKLFY
ncbi:MAG: hypothetical protein IKJ19_07680 [Clostridia bacterium]|nr:hypothetical protein [Clostridia bacterium]